MRSSNKKKIKIVELTPCLEGGGAEKIAKTLASELNRQDFDLTVISLSSPVKMTWPNIDRIVFMSKKQGFNLQIIFRLRKIFKEIRPDIIHNHHLFSLIYIIPANFLLRAKIVQTIHANLDGYANPKLWKFIFSLFHIHSVNLSPNLNLLFQTKNNTNIANGINTRSMGKANKRFNKNILNIGRLEDQKNHTLLLKIFKEILIRDKDYKLTILGKGSLEEKLKAEIKSLGISKNVKMITERRNSVDLLEKATFYIGTSKTEGMPVSIIEALTKGLIVFSSEAGANDLIKNARNGFVFSSFDQQRIAKQFFKYADNKRALKAIRQMALTSAKNFDSSVMLEKYSKLFKKLCR